MKQLVFHLIVLQFVLVPIDESFGQTDATEPSESEFQFDLSGLSAWIKSQSAHEEKTAQRLKLILRATWSYEFDNGKFPFNATQGTEFPGWRALLLKQLGSISKSHERGKMFPLPRIIFGENEFEMLEKEIMYREAWNSSSNELLKDRMPDLFGADNKPDIFWVDGAVLSFGSIGGGAANRIAFVCLPPQDINWMKRQPIQPEVVVEIVNGMKDGEHILAGFYDRKVMRITNSIDEQTLRILLKTGDRRAIDWWKVDYRNQIDKRLKLVEDHHAKAKVLIEEGQLEWAINLLYTTPTADGQSRIATLAQIVDLYKELLNQAASDKDEHFDQQKIANWKKTLAENSWQLQMLRTEIQDK